MTVLSVGVTGALKARLDPSVREEKDGTWFVEDEFIDDSSANSLS